MNLQDEIALAADRIAPFVRQTPCVVVHGFGLDHPLEMKLEHIQHTGSFKPRGAFNTILAEPVPDAGLVAASGGNHGAAVGFAAARLGHRAAIFVPQIAGPAKIALIDRTGADLHVVPGAYSEALAAAQAYEMATGAGQVHAYDALATVAGQGTVMREWELQGLEADTVLIAVGGGGLIAGALAWVQDRRKIVAVEPETCATLHHARRAGAPTDIEVSGVAANALGARRIGQLCFDLAQQHDIETVLVSDTAILLAQTAIWHDMRQLVEPAGAAALAALLSGAYTPEPDERVAVLLCGANPAPDPFQDET